MASDCASTFSYDDESLQSDSFSLTELNNAVDAHFDESCVLTKLAQGGYHKVYDIQKSNGVPLEAVVRVASPAFPRDKLESEIATLRFISSQTTIPVPRVYIGKNPLGSGAWVLLGIINEPDEHVIRHSGALLRASGHQEAALEGFGGLMVISSMLNITLHGPKSLDFFFECYRA